MRNSQLLKRVKRSSDLVGRAVLEVLETRRMLATITVNDTGDVTAVDANTTLREALAQAATQAGDDTIVFDATVFPAATPKTITLLQGALQVNSNVTIQGTGSSNLSIDANDLSRVFDVGSVTAIMNALTITGGRASFGGGISNVGNLTLNDAVVTGNLIPNSNVGVGGGIYTRGPMSINNSAVDANQITFPVFGGGAGIYVDATTVNFFNSDVTGNTSQGQGGGIWVANNGTVNLTNSDVADNDADKGGGGIFNESGTTNLVRSTVDGNDANASAGGGIYNNSTLKVSSSTISNNSAISNTGGGVFNNAGTSTIENSTVSGNDATNGAGVAAATGTVNITQSTVADNDAVTTGGGVLQQASSVITLKNTIVATNTAPTGPDLAGAFSASSSFNVIGSITGSTGITNGANGNQAGTTALPLDAKLNALANNGGPTDTHSILTSSPAFNTGSNANIPPSTPSDQRGSLRIVNSIVDVGAYENQTVVGNPPPGQTAFPGPGNFQIAAAGTSRLEAENFDNGGQTVSWFDTSIGNQGGQYRANVDPDIQTLAGDATGGNFYIGITKTNEWLEYTADIAQAGTYNVGFRNASNGAGGKFHLEVDGSPVTSQLTIPNTGGWNTWTTVTANNVSLPAGTHVIRLQLENVGATGSVGNFNYLTFTPSVAPVQQTINTNTAAHVRDGGSAGANFGNSTTLEVKKSTAGFNRESWIKFDISGTTTISNAILRVRGSLFDANTPSIQLGVYQGQNGWTEGGITFNNKPPVGAQITTKTIAGTTPTTYDIDVTSFLQAQKTAGATEVTFVLRSNTSTSTLSTFNSDEAANPPQLIVAS